MYPKSYDEFQLQQTIAFKKGVDKGIDLYREHCKKGMEFLKEKKISLEIFKEIKNGVPKKNLFDGCVSEKYALEKLKMKSAELFEKDAVEEENLITKYLNPEDVGKVWESDKDSDNVEDEELIPEKMLTDLESNDDKAESENSGRRKWFLSKMINGNKKEIHLSQALKLLIPREFVSRERSRRHIASKFLPDRGEISELHNVILFRFVVAKISGKINICKVAALNSNGKSVKSASNLDDGVTCQLIPLEKVKSEKDLYVLPHKIVVSSWMKVSNILGEVKMSCNKSNQFSILEKSLSVLDEAEQTLNEAADRKFAQSVSKSLPPVEFREVEDIIDKKIDPKTEEYLYLVKFKGGEGTPVWLNQSCFDRKIHFSKRKGFHSNEKIHASENSSFMELALKNAAPEKATSSKRKSSSSTTTPIPAKKKRQKAPPVSEKSKFVLKAFSFDKPQSSEEQKDIVVVDVDNSVSPDTEISLAGCSDEKIFQDAMKKVDNGEWISGVIVKRAAEMLKVQFPNLHGLQETLKSKSQLSKFKSVDFNVDSLQMHHDGGCHWVLSSSKGCDVFVYDSLYDRPTEDLKAQLLLCYKNFKKVGQLKVQFKPVNKQSGSSDCGLFVIAYAFDIASGRSPEKVFYNQSAMRKHLLTCINTGSLSSFPIVLNDNLEKACSIFMIN